jgi:sugar phosphate isomerase/epimerase
MTWEINRRRFLATATAAGAVLSTPQTLLTWAESSSIPKRKFYSILSLGRIGFHASFPESVELATKYGFEGLDPDANYFASLDNDALKHLLDDLRKRNLKFGAAGLPVEFRKDSDTFNDGFKQLPSVAATLQRVGIWRVSTWILPCNNDLNYQENFRQHTDRLRQCAQVLADHGQKLGLEYVAPHTLLHSQKYQFIHNLSGMKNLIAAIGTKNVGVQLDSWHWFNAQETTKDLLTLHNSDILTVDLNDAPKGLTLDQYQDNHRELPSATGVIPVKQFLDALAQIGYDGPIQAEPFNDVLKAMPIDQACAATAAAMKKSFALM